MYAKDDFPQVPIHPNCLCTLVEWYGDVPKKTTFTTVYKYMEGLPESERAKMIGKANAQLKGEGVRRGLAKRGIGVDYKNNADGEMRMMERHEIPDDALKNKNEENDKKVTTSGAEGSIFISMGDQIENKLDGIGIPSDIYRHNRPLNNRQQKLLDKLPEYDSRVTVDKIKVSMMDLSALTAKEGVEFSMFTRGQERLIVRGNERHVNVNAQDAAKLNRQGYKWSGHTHVGMNLIPSPGDHVVLREFEQSESVIYNAVGNFSTFRKF